MLNKCGIALVSLISLTSALGCGSDADLTQLEPGDEKADRPTAKSEAQCIKSTPTYPKELQNVVGCTLWKFLQKKKWGDMHWDFHTLRRWYGLSDEMKEELRHQQLSGVGLLQEGDPGSGLEFCVMHRAMIGQLKAQFAANSDDCSIGSSAAYEKAKVDNPVCAYRYVFDGWNSDAKILAEVKAVYGEGDELKIVRSAVRNLSKYSAFSQHADVQSWGVEDAWCLALQTPLRLTSLDDRPDQSDPEARFYVQMDKPWAGIHNQIHGLFSAGEPGAPKDDERIDVGDPGANLANRLFWGIHGWVESKYLAAREHFERPVDAPEYERLKFGTQGGYEQGGCGDSHGQFWDPQWDADLERTRESDGTEDDVQAERALRVACGDEYVTMALRWRLTAHLHGSGERLSKVHNDLLKRAKFFVRQPEVAPFPQVAKSFAHQSVPPELDDNP